MKQIITFDTNFFRKYSLEKLEDIDKSKYDLYCLEIVIEELKGQLIRKEIDKISELKKFLEDKEINKMYEFKEKVKIDKYLEDIQKNVDAFACKYFGDNVIEISDYAEKLERIMVRNKFKKPPFNKDPNASDKGFSDAIIWESILKFGLENSDKYERIIFVTDDNAFISNINFLTKEFYDLTNKEITILKESSFNDLMGDKENKKSKELIESKPINVDAKIDPILLSRIKRAVNELFYFTDFDGYDNPYSRSICTLYQIVNNDQVLEICNKMLELKDKYFFFEDINIENFFINEKINVNFHHKVSKDDFFEFLDCFNIIKNKYSSYLDKFIFYITDILNSSYEDPDFLPF